ncbi:hypothetical protein [Alkalihalobacterium chitinilyticum]|uniref:Cell wall-active antibiotics response LiaF-like C-terminal domain-containing protein n=1 Tax=Alkalihalobacterium chitinilyticum TaxID=2980103 RepID=A0ABT5VD43_9BACI|nr:hypothetical protein [Alkalihalobacterium chitinilyticum]MDE5413361.1 hypothetical protein [Alkalihalobacterium chitinilyticum]
MQPIIEKIFGQPYKDSKLMLFSYWSGILFYIIVLLFFIMQAVVGGQWLSVLAIAIAFPVLFRIVYSLNGSLMRKFTGLRKRGIFLFAGVIGVISIIFVGAVMLFADNLAINASKTEVNGHVIVSIGSLKGSYLVDDVRVIEEGMVGIPYRASIGEGDILLVVERGGDVVWEDKVSPQTEGMIQFYGGEGRYQIRLYTEHAEDINLEVITGRLRK